MTNLVVFLQVRKPPLPVTRPRLVFESAPLQQYAKQYIALCIAALLGMFVCIERITKQDKLRDKRTHILTMEYCDDALSRAYGFLCEPISQYDSRLWKSH